MSPQAGAERWAYVALGSNLSSVFGAPKDTVQSAVLSLSALTVAPLRVSSLWQSAPLDCPPGSPHFVNAVVALQPRRDWDARQLLEALQELEKAYGRQPAAERNAPRPLDLDIIDFAGQQSQAPELQLPHPRATQRLFVLLPLAEVAPTLVLPGQQQPVSHLLEALQEKSEGVEQAQAFTRLD